MTDDQKIRKLLMQRIRRQTPESRAQQKARRDSAEHKVYMAEYYKKNAERRNEYNRMYYQDIIKKDPAARYRRMVYNREYKKQEKARDRRRAYAQTQWAKDKTKVSNQRESVKERKRLYDQRLEVKAARRERGKIYSKNRRGDAKYIAYMKEYNRRFGGSHYGRAVRRGNCAERFARISIFERDNYVCAYCKGKLNIKTAQLEHIIPISKGGSHTPGNCTTSCAKCNLEKMDKLLNGAQLTIFDKVSN